MVGLYKADSLDEFAVSGLRACANIVWDALHAPPSVCRLLDLRSFGEGVPVLARFGTSGNAISNFAKTG